MYLILTDREIEAAISSKHIVVEPKPRPEAFSSTSLDLTLAPRARTWKAIGAAGVIQEIDPTASGYSFLALAAANCDEVQIPAGGYLLEPKSFLLGWTAEEIELCSASRIAARVEGKSSLARLGIAVHVTAPTIHAGFKGPIQLEITNVGPLRVRLKPNMPVCQLIFEQTLGTPHKGYQGQFFGQKS